MIWIEVRRKSGELRYRWQIEIQMPAVSVWQDRIIIREAAVNEYIQTIQLQILQYFDLTETEFYIVFESKMSSNEKYNQNTCNTGVIGIDG